MALETELQKILIRLVGDGTSYEKVLKQAQGLTVEFSKTMTALGEDITRKLTVPLVGIGGASTRAFSDFEQAMTEAVSIMRVTDEQIQKMTEHALELATHGTQAPRDLAQSYYFLASAGFEAESAIENLAVVQKFAHAGAFDLETATELAANALSVMGLKTGDAHQDMINMTRVTNSITSAMTQAPGSVKQFAQALTNDAGTAAHNLGIEVEAVMAALDAYAERGKRGGVAGAMLGRAYRLLASSASVAAKGHQKHGLRVFEDTGKMRDMWDIAADLERIMGKLTAKQRIPVMKELGFEVLAQKAITPLIGMSGQMKKWNELHKENGDITERIAQTQLKSFSSQMKILKNQITVVAIEIGRILAPALLKLNAFLSMVAMGWRKLPEGVKQTIVSIGAFLAVIGPGMIAMGLLSKVFMMVAGSTTVFGKALRLLGSILLLPIRLIKLYITTSWLLSGVLTSLLNPILMVQRAFRGISMVVGLIILGISSVVASIKLLVGRVVALAIAMKSAVVSGAALKAFIAIMTPLAYAGVGATLGLVKGFTLLYGGLKILLVPFKSVLGVLALLNSPAAILNAMLMVVVTTFSILATAVWLVIVPFTYLATPLRLLAVTIYSVIQPLNLLLLGFTLAVMPMSVFYITLLIVANPLRLLVGLFPVLTFAVGLFAAAMGYLSSAIASTLIWLYLNLFTVRALKSPYYAVVAVLKTVQAAYYGVSASLKLFSSLVLFSRLGIITLTVAFVRSNAVALLWAGTVKAVSSAMFLLRIAIMGVMMVLGALGIGVLIAAVGIFIESIGGLEVAWEAVKIVAEDAWASIKDSMAGFVAWAEPIWGAMLNFFVASWQFMRETAQAVWQGIQDGLQRLAKIANSVFSGISLDGTISWQKIGEAIVNYFHAAEFAMLNFSLLWKYVWTSAILFFIKTIEDIKFFFTSTLPETFAWFGRGMVKTFFNLTDTVVVFFVQMAKGIVRVIANIPKLLSGEVAWDQVWNPAFKAFESGFGRLDIPKRIKGQLEVQLGKEVDTLGNTIDDAFQRFKDQKLKGADKDTVDALNTLFKKARDRVAAKKKGQEDGEQYSEAFGKEVKDTETALFYSQEAISRILAYTNKFFPRADSREFAKPFDRSQPAVVGALGGATGGGNEGAKTVSLLTEAVKHLAKIANTRQYKPLVPKRANFDLP